MLIMASLVLKLRHCVACRGHYQEMDELRALSRKRQEDSDKRLDECVVSIQVSKG